MLEETNASGVAQADYIYLDGRPIATMNPSTGALYFLHDDMLGTPQLATDSSKAVAWQASYQPFGTALVSGTVTQSLRFPGQYFDVESGWNHNGLRNYLPDLGRYAEPDPLGMQENPSAGRSAGDFLTNAAGSSSSLYSYAGDNPINSEDPSGEFAIPGTNWCGPDWTGGRIESYDPNHDLPFTIVVSLTSSGNPQAGVSQTPYYSPPTNSVDSVCKTHDICYYRARNAYPCDKEKRRQAMEQCDASLLAKMPTDTALGAVVYAGIRVHPADPGNNDSSCKCKTQ